jgi:oligopeptide/dipeptide ABC transporter ATP-binding protein
MTEAAKALRETILDVRDLTASFSTDSGELRAVDRVSFSIGQGEAVALVGESGCGKSVTALSIMRLVSSPGRITGGQIEFRGTDLLALSEDEIRKYRGDRIAMIFQEPMTSLNPVMKIGDQVGEPLRVHRNMSRRESWDRAAALLDLVSIPDARKRLDDYPHQMSGGMRQRVMIAMAMACSPKVLIADEPTTAVDVTIQAQILALVRRLRDDTGMGVLLITHDLGVVAGMADHVVVMYAGVVMEEAPVRTLFAAPLHPYTRLLLKSIPRVGAKAARLHQIAGTTPPPSRFPAGCRFHPRCPDAADQCRTEVPLLETLTDGRRVRCWRAHETCLPSMAP